MVAYQANSISDARLLSADDKAGLGWDFPSLKKHMDVRLLNVRQNKNDKQAHESKTAPRKAAEKEISRS